MKILHVIASVDPRGGGPIEGIRSFSEVWTALGHECHILSLDDPDAEWVKQSPQPTVAVGGASVWTVPGLGYTFTAGLVAWLRTHAEAYSAVIIHGLWNYASVGTWRALAGSSTPYFVFTHGMLDPWFLRAYPRKAMLKAVFWKLFEHRVLRDAAGVLFTSEDERDLAAQSFSPYDVRPVVVGFGASDIDGDRQAYQDAFAVRFPLLNGRRFVLFLGRIHPKKGVDLLIKAFADLAADYPDLDLVIAGPDQVGWQRELTATAEALGVAARIHWPGMLTGDAKWGAFIGATCFALPSHQENFGVAVAEALILGTPVLITHKVNIWRQIEADAAGVVVDDQADDVGRGLRAMCAMSDTDRQAMSHNARQCYLRHYDLKTIAVSLLDVMRAPQTIGSASPRTLARQS